MLWPAVGKQKPRQGWGTAGSGGKADAAAGAARAARAAQGVWGTAPHEAGQQPGSPASLAGALSGWLGQGLGRQGPAPGGGGQAPFGQQRPGPEGGGGLLRGSRGRTWGALFPAWAPRALTRVGTATGSGSSSSGVRKRMAKDRYLSRGRRHVGAIFCGDTRSGREREQRPPLPP